MGEDRLSPRTIERGGQCFRVADPEWRDPLDPTHAKEAGGRWNDAGSFPVLSLNADVATARANVDRKFAGLPYGPTDLLPERRPVLVGADVPTDGYLDVVTDEGCEAVELPRTYPRDGSGREVGHRRCQRVGRKARHEWGLPGVAYRSAARPRGEELAWFTDSGGSPTRVEAFDDWYWGGSASPPRRP